MIRKVICVFTICLFALGVAASGVMGAEVCNGACCMAHHATGPQHHEHGAESLNPHGNCTAYQCSLGAMLPLQMANGGMSLSVPDRLNGVALNTHAGAWDDLFLHTGFQQRAELSPPRLGQPIYLSNLSFLC